MPDLFLELRYSEESDGVDIEPLTEDETIALLLEAEFTGSKLIPWGSNYSFAVALEDASGREHLAIYKPQGGENPALRLPGRDAVPARGRGLPAFSVARLADRAADGRARRTDGIGSLQLYVAAGGVPGA